MYCQYAYLSPKQHEYLNIYITISTHKNEKPYLSDIFFPFEHLHHKNIIHNHDEYKHHNFLVPSTPTNYLSIFTWCVQQCTSHFYNKYYLLAVKQKKYDKHLHVKMDWRRCIISGVNVLLTNFVKP